MKPAILASALLATVLTGAAFAQSGAQKSFDQLKALSGNWEGKDAQGKTLSVSFRSTAGDSALMSEIHGTAPENMISMFHLDGPNRLLLTHYCSAGNQPRMVASASPDGKTITFNFLDAPEFPSPAFTHKRPLHLEFTFCIAELRISCETGGEFLEKARTILLVNMVKLQDLCSE